MKRHGGGGKKGRGGLVRRKIHRFQIFQPQQKLRTPGILDPAVQHTVYSLSSASVLNHVYTGCFPISNDCIEHDGRDISDDDDGDQFW